LCRLPAQLIGGDMRLDVGRAETAVSALAARLGLNLRETASGILRIVNSNMVRAIRAVSIERGYDPRRFTLMPFGGAGALHAVDVARELGMATILVPPAPGILCAEGVSSAQLEEGFVAVCRMPLSEDLGAVAAAIGRLRAQVDDWFAREDAEGCRGECVLLLDMRYIGQNFELSVPVANQAAMPVASDLAAAFRDLHKAKYGHADASAAIEIVNVRLLARIARSLRNLAPTFPARARSETPVSARAATALPTTRHSVWFETGRTHEALLLDRSSIGPGTVLDQPAVITQFDATTLLPPGCRLTVIGNGSLLIEVAP
jgi:N-methylhydantoinase A